MKKAFLMSVVSFFLIQCSEDKKIEPKVVTHHFSSEDEGEAHKSAAVFAHMVGDSLKKYFPAQVNNITVDLFIKEGIFNFVWECHLDPSTEKEADYYFDREGALFSGRTLCEAYQRVDRDLRKNEKALTLIEQLGRDRGRYFFKTIQRRSEGSFWCLKEFFCIAPK